MVDNSRQDRTKYELFRKEQNVSAALNKDMGITIYNMQCASVHKIFLIIIVTGEKHISR